MASGNDPITVFVCATCRPEGDATEPRPGARLCARLTQAVGQRDLANEICVAAVACLSVCKRPVTIAVTGGGARWSYLWGDIPVDTDLDALITGLQTYRQTSNGIVPWRSRPEMLRRGLVARIPPFPGASTNPDTSILPSVEENGST